MSDRDGGGVLAPFLLGIAVGAALGALFAPDTGSVTRRQLRKKLRGLRDLAEDKADELKSLMAGAGAGAGADDDDEFDEFEESEEPDDADEKDEADEGSEDAAAAEPKSARAELEHRLAEARRRRRQAGRPRDAKEDEPVA